MFYASVTTISLLHDRSRATVAAVLTGRLVTYARSVKIGPVRRVVRDVRVSVPLVQLLDLSRLLTTTSAYTRL